MLVLPLCSSATNDPIDGKVAEGTFPCRATRTSCLDCGAIMMVAGHEATETKPAISSSDAKSAGDRRSISAIRIPALKVRSSAASQSRTAGIDMSPREASRRIHCPLAQRGAYRPGSSGRSLNQSVGGRRVGQVQQADALSCSEVPEQPGRRATCSRLPLLRNFKSSPFAAAGMARTAPDHQDARPLQYFVHCQFPRVTERRSWPQRPGPAFDQPRS